MRFSMAKLGWNEWVVQSAESSRLPVILPCEMVEKSAS